MKTIQYPVFRAFLHCFFWVLFRMRWLQFLQLSNIPLCSISCNQRPLLLNYGVWIWTLWWPSPSDPMTDPSVRTWPFSPLLCVLRHIFFFFIYGIFMKGEMKGGGSPVLCSHIYPLQRLWAGALCLLWFCVGYTLSSRVGGHKASLPCR